MTKATTKAEFARLSEALPGLSPDQLEQVRLRVSHLLHGSASRRPAGAPGPGRADDDDDWLLRGVEEELRRRGLHGSGRLYAEKIAPGWGQASAAVRADLRFHLEVGGRRWRHPWAALGRIAARALADYLAGGRIPVTPRTMLRNADKIMVALDDQFPGYVEAGLLHCCLDPSMVGAD